LKHIGDKKKVSGCVFVGVLKVDDKKNAASILHQFSMFMTIACSDGSVMKN